MPYTRVILLTTIIIIGCHCLFAQSDDLKAKALSGDIYFVPFFINTSEGEFTEGEIQHYLTELQESKEWILSQKQAYSQVDLSIIDDHTDSQEEIIHLDKLYSYRGNQYNTRYLMSKVAVQLGFNSMEQYINFNHIDTKISKAVVLCFVKQSGRSHTFNFNEKLFSKDIRINHVLIHCSTHNRNQQKSNAISHEILHLFGAWDLNGRLAQNPEKAAKLKEMYPNSIMVKSIKSGQNNIDEITAWRIGWNLKPEHSFPDYKPEYEKNEKDIRDKNKFRGNTIQFDLKKKKNRN